MTKTTKNQILHNLYLQKSFGFQYVDSFSLKEAESLNNFMSKEVISHCILCDASKISNNKIYDFGDENSPIIFITTTPKLDKASQDMFIKMVENVLNIKFQNIYIASIIKCEISDKNPMIETYIQTCKGYILNQIDTSNAKIIVTLGDSYKYLVGDNSDISTIRGNIVKFHNKTIIPIYHPSFLLRNPSFKKDTLEDLKKIKLLMEQ